MPDLNLTRLIPCIRVSDVEQEARHVRKFMDLRRRAALLLHFDHGPLQVSRRVRNDNEDVIAIGCTSCAARSAQIGRMRMTMSMPQQKALNAGTKSWSSALNSGRTGALFKHESGIRARPITAGAHYKYK